MRFSRWWYYLTSIPTLLMGITNWPSLLIWLIRPAPRGFAVVTLRGGLRFEARSLMDIWVIKETCLDQGYEQIAVPIQPAWTMMDIGAALGDFTVDAARKAPQGVVYAFEPFPTSFELLERNIARNGITNAHIHNVAISAQAGTLTLRTDPAEAVMHRAAAYSDASGAAEITVQAVPLDAIFADHHIERCDFMKIDTEGAEYEILMSASPATLARIQHIAMETHDGVTPYSHTDLMTFLENHGFRVTWQENPAHAYLGMLHAENRSSPNHH